MNVILRAWRWLVNSSSSAEAKVASPTPFESTGYNDAPIVTIEQDLYDFDPFASALANAIRNVQSPEGSVVALNGVWGSGKSSVVNLCLRHLEDLVTSKRLRIISFSSWWFRGEEALALAFFRELYAGMAPSLGQRAKELLPKMGARLLKAGAAISGKSGVAGAATGKVLDWAAELIKTDESVEGIHSKLSAALANQPSRFLVVIDDIDRLSPDEALLIFRLVKSAGRLANVMYLLVFDRFLAEKIVTERFPSEGADYLEKIIQTSFDLPSPDQSDLSNQLLEFFDKICGESLPQDEEVEVANKFFAIVAPEIKTPRDVVRFMNALANTWPAVRGEVDFGDFMAMEALRLHQPAIYQAIRGHKEALVSAIERQGDRAAYANSLDQIFLGTIEERSRDHYRQVLKRLFPRLGNIWGNTFYAGGDEWARKRRVCSADHFDAYFRFHPGVNALRRDEITQLIAQAGDEDFVERAFRAALLVQRRNRRTKAALLLGELTLRASDIANDDVEPLLTCLFRIADTLDVPKDEEEAGMVTNLMRLHWLLRRLVMDRFSLDRRTEIFLHACRTASIGWLVDFAESAYRNHNPRQGDEPKPEAGCLTTTRAADDLRTFALQRIREVAEGQDLLGHTKLGHLLFGWRDLAGDEEVKEWTATQMDNDLAIVAFSRAFTGVAHVTSLGFDGLGDLVSRRRMQAQVRHLDTVLDVARFRERVEAVANNGTAPGHENVAVFLEAWQRQEKNPRDL